MYILIYVHIEGAGPVEARIQHSVAFSMALHRIFLKQGLSLNMVSSFTSQPAFHICLSGTQLLGYQCAAVPGLLCGCWWSELGLHASMSGALLSHLPPQPQVQPWVWLKMWGAPIANQQGTCQQRRTVVLTAGEANTGESLEPQGKLGSITMPCPFNK